jgi:drug/metabolite transporter (DMT)-like permease
MTPLRLLGGVLVFAGVALLAGATVATVDWALCLAGGGGQGCRQSKADAAAAWVGAANVALGIAIQSRPQP